MAKELEEVVKLVSSNGKRALDFGAGTGNITGKLLRLGYEVTAVDISKEMSEVLQNKYADFVKKGMLHVINSKIEDAEFGFEEFDLITCYAVLHHLPDYEQVIRQITLFLKKGGIIYLDHEISPFNGSADRITRAYYYTVWLLNSLTGLIYSQVKEANDDIKNVNHAEFALSDYWAQPERKIDQKKIELVFKELDLAFTLRKDYHLHRTRVFNPVFCVFKRTSNPDMSCWIARK